MRGGEIGFMGRGQLVPEYAAVAFNLNDPKKVSKIVETEYGYHIIQLIEKRGDRINTRHILLRPKVAKKDLDNAKNRLDTLRAEIVDKKNRNFEEAVRLVSQDKDTRMSNGVMVNPPTAPRVSKCRSATGSGQSRGHAQSPARYRSPSKCATTQARPRHWAMVRLTSRIDAHQANLADDFRPSRTCMKTPAARKIVDKWLQKKIEETYVRIEDGWRGCDFRPKGWIKSAEK